MASKKSIEEIVAAVDAATVVLNKAKAALDSAVQSEEAGAYFYIDEIPYEVELDDKGKKILKCGYNKRLLAMKRGEKLPPVRKRTRKGDESEAA